MINNITITNSSILSNNWYTLKKITYQYTKKDGSLYTQTREAYDRGDGAVILLYNTDKQTVILTRQFRLPTFINGNETGMLIEACAGQLEKNNPEVCIKKEAEEETGYRINAIQKVFEAYMSPGSVTEILYFFIAAYTDDMKISAGGGVVHEEENIEVLELPIDTAMQMIRTGNIKDGKTIMLLQHVKLSGIL
jgi:GDP-mannose pyrophosphatase NudK